MSNEIPIPTVAERMLTSLEKINKSLEELKVKGLPMSFILLYVGKKTHLSQKDIMAVFDALRDLNTEIRPR